MYRIESTIVEELKERGLNATDLLQKCAGAEKYKKQRELLEECDIIYRLSRTPERRVFYIDVGNLPLHRALAYFERIKNEIQQR